MILRFSLRCCNPDCNEKAMKIGGIAFSIEWLCPKCRWTSVFQTAEHGVEARAVADSKGKEVVEK